MTFSRTRAHVVCLVTTMLCWTAGLAGQTGIDLRTQSKSVDFSGASFTKPFRTSSSLPATCQVGESVFLTTAPAGQNLYGCPAANVWTQLSGGGAVDPGQGITVLGATVAVDDALVPQYFTGSGMPAIGCQPGRDVYTDVAEGKLYFCRGINTWQQASAGEGGSGSGNLLFHTRTTAPIDGIGAERDLWSYSLPGGALTDGSCLDVHFAYERSGTVASVSYRLYFGTGAFTYYTGTANPIGSLTICNVPGSTTEQYIVTNPGATTGASLIAPTWSGADLSINTSNPVTVRMAFTVAGGTGVRIRRAEVRRWSR